ncbi:MAG TPA: ABC transporter substrate-binding protein [Micromonosporaceae bacterium]|nr:ABC transporter substrate-binding protein [Micromonosporaceae bacterium]
MTRLPSYLDRRQVLKLFGAVAAVGATGSAAACTASPMGMQMEQPSGRTIMIGLVAPALGPYAGIGNDIQRGFKLFLEDNDQLLGLHRVDLRTAEEGATAESASAAVTDLINQGVMALAGVVNPAALSAVAPMVQDARIPLVSSHAAPSTLTTQIYIWRVSHVEGEAGIALAPYARDEGNTSYLLYDESSGRAEAEAFRRAFTDLGGAILGEYTGNSFRARLNEARNLGAATIFAAHAGDRASDLLQAYRDSGLSVKLLGPAMLTETFDLNTLSPLPDNVYTASFYAPDIDNEANRRFVSSYHQVYGVQPSSFAMAGYDSASVLDKALRLIEGEPNAAALNQAFSLLGQIDSPRGTWTFNQNRTPQQRWSLRRLRRDGQVAGNLLDADLQVLS